MARHQWETIVIGAGAIGTATAYWLTQRGQSDVLVLEQFDLGHDRGASEDHSRVIRHSYHDNVYGRLTQAAYDNWDRLGVESGQQILFRTGGLDIAVAGTDGERSVEQYRRVLADNGHPYDALGKAELIERYPQWEIDEDVVATYQKDSGLVDIRRSCQTHLALATAAGASVRANCAVRRIESLGDGVRVHTDAETFTADHVVVATASWADELLAPLGQTWTTTISQVQVAYLVPTRLRDFAVGTFPIWGWHSKELFYGFPIYGEVAIKVARDVSGNFVTQQTRTMEPSEAETEFLTAFVRDKLPSAAGRLLYSKTCVYDMPPDRDFVLDALPGHPRVIVGLGAAHAGKFAGLLGEIVSDLVVSGRSEHDIAAFAADRPALRDPSYRPSFLLQG